MTCARIVAAWMLALCATGAVAAEAPAARIRGTIEKVEGNVLTVRTREGKPATVRLADDVAVAGVIPASLADVTPGKFIGTATLGQKDGALEALIFPESMRGFGEGHHPWDLEPQSMMTNATVADVVAGPRDRVLTLRYKPYAHVFVGAPKRQPDGNFTAARITVGLNGLVPPM
jgi:hypothetical protein